MAERLQRGARRGKSISCCATAFVSGARRRSARGFRPRTILRASHGVSRVTVRRALAELAARTADRTPPQRRHAGDLSAARRADDGRYFRRAGQSRRHGPSAPRCKLLSFDYVPATAAMARGARRSSRATCCSARSACALIDGDAVFLSDRRMCPKASAVTYSAGANSRRRPLLESAGALRRQGRARDASASAPCLPTPGCRRTALERSRRLAADRAGARRLTTVTVAASSICTRFTGPTATILKSISSAPATTERAHLVARMPARRPHRAQTTEHESRIASRQTAGLSSCRSASSNR